MDSNFDYNAALVASGIPLSNLDKLREQIDVERALCSVEATSSDYHFGQFNGLRWALAILTGETTGVFVPAHFLLKPDAP